MKRVLKQTTSLIFVATLSMAGAASAQNFGATLWISDSGTRTVYEVPLNGGPPLRSFHTPENARSGLAIDPIVHTLWAASEPKSDTIFGSLVNFAEDGSVLTEIGADLFDAFGVEGVAVDYLDGTLWVVDDPVGVFPGEIPTVHHIAKDGGLITSFPTSTFDIGSQSPQAIAADPDGTLWVTDNSTETVYNIHRDGALISSFRVKDQDDLADNLQGISVNESDGTLWVTDRTSHRIYNFTRTGQLISFFDSKVYDETSFNPTAIAYDGSGLTNVLRSVIADLYLIVDALPSNVTGDDEKDRELILDAIKHIEKSLKPNKVFKEIEKVVAKLLKVKNKNDATDVSEAIATLTNFLHDLALAEFDKAQIMCDADPGSKACAKVAESDIKFSEAQIELDKGKPNKAIKKYKDAWKKAHQAIKKLQGK